MRRTLMLINFNAAGGMKLLLETIKTLVAVTIVVVVASVNFSVAIGLLTPLFAAFYLWMILHHRFQATMLCCITLAIVSIFKTPSYPMVGGFSLGDLPTWATYTLIGSCALLSGVLRILITETIKKPEDDRK